MSWNRYGQFRTPRVRQTFLSAVTLIPSVLAAALSGLQYSFSRTSMVMVRASRWSSSFMPGFLRGRILTKLLDGDLGIKTAEGEEGSVSGLAGKSEPCIRLSGVEYMWAVVKS
eukprot:208666-Rhodomonas_salina.2